MKAVALAFILLLPTGCAHKTAVEKLGNEFTILRGKLASEPTIEAGGNRLFIYLEVESEVEDEYEIVVCIAVNKDRERILKETHAMLMAAINEPVFLYGKEIEGQYEEFVDGVDFLTSAVGVYHEPAKKYRVIMVTYGPSVRDAVRSMKWGKFMKTVGKAAFKAANPL